MNHVVVILHGIEARPYDFLWSDEFEVWLKPAMPQVQMIAHSYGYVSAWKAWMWQSYREQLVEDQVAWFRRLIEYWREVHGSIPKVSVFGHSLGGFFITELMRNYVKLHNVIHMMGASPSDFPWGEYDQCFNRVYVYHSPNDEKLGWSHFGKMGLEGPSVTHPRVLPIETNWTHDQFMNVHLMAKMKDSYVQQLTED